MESSTAGRWLFRVGISLLIFFHILIFFSPQFKLFFYPLAWWSFILTLEGYNSLQGRAIFLQKKVSYFLYICAISAFLWFIFETFNLYLGNWYYVLAFKPLSDNLPARWLGATFCFATVLPGLWEVQRTVYYFLPPSLDQFKKFKPSRKLLWALLIIGILGVFGPLLAPTYMFPFVWLGLLLVVEFVEYRSGGPSFLGEFSAGKYRLLISWLLAGAVCGFLWEFWNHFARTGWIYTVPFMGEWRLFEMPVLGYFGFPPFALMVWRLFVFIDRNYRSWNRKVRFSFWPGVIIFCLLVLCGMEIYTNVPAYNNLEDYQVWTRQEARIIHRKNLQTPRQILKADTPEKMKKKARLILLGKMGTKSASCLTRADITSIEKLKKSSTGQLAPLLLECHGGRLSFWQRRIKDWKQRAN